MTSFSVSKVSVGVLNLLNTSFISPNPSDDGVDVLETGFKFSLLLFFSFLGFKPPTKSIKTLRTYQLGGSYIDE